MYLCLQWQAPSSIPPLLLPASTCCSTYWHLDLSTLKTSEPSCYNLKSRSVCTSMSKLRGFCWFVLHLQWQAPSSIPVSGACIDLLQHILVPDPFSPYSYCSFSCHHLHRWHTECTSCQTYYTVLKFCCVCHAVTGAQQHTPLSAACINLLQHILAPRLSHPKTK
jgi:hypothetical protein